MIRFWIILCLPALVITLPKILTRKPEPVYCSLYCPNCGYHHYIRIADNIRHQTQTCNRCHLPYWVIVKKFTGKEIDVDIRRCIK